MRPAAAAAASSSSIAESPPWVAEFGRAGLGIIISLARPRWRWHCIIPQPQLTHHTTPKYLGPQPCNRINGVRQPLVRVRAAGHRLPRARGVPRRGLRRRRQQPPAPARQRRPPPPRRPPPQGGCRRGALPLDRVGRGGPPACAWYVRGGGNGWMMGWWMG